MQSQTRHARPCAGHPRLNSTAARKTWMAGTSPAMTKRDSEITVAQSPASWFEMHGIAARLTMRVGDLHPEERALARVSKDAAPALENALAGKLSRQHLFQDLPADGLVGQRRLAPPPAVPLHLFGRGDKAISYLRKIRIAVVQAEDQPAGADPAQREPFGAQVILQHPVVAGRLGVMHPPDRGQVGEADRQILRGQPVGP